jgi:leader peptidase (prepilin peptidase)/N-methyltransferase
MDLSGGRASGGTAGAPVVACVRRGLKSTLFGEYVSQLLLLWGVFGACWWSSAVLSATGFAALMAGSCLWCAARAVGCCAASVLTLTITLVLIVLTAWCAGMSPAGVPDWMMRSAISPAVLTGILTVVLGLDYVESRQRMLSSVPLLVRRRWLGFELLVGLATIWLGWSFGAALFFQARDLRSGGVGVDSVTMSFGGRVAFHAGEGLVTCCVLALGGNIGSFLNVLVYRLPRGLDVVSSRSRCPDCGAAIAGRDNVPIFGWLFLGGRCRACGIEISSEYPRVEAASAGIFLLMYFAELLTGGLNIPFRQPNLYAGVLWTVMYPKFDLIGIWLLHVLLLTTLLVYSRLQYSGHTVSIRATAILSALVLLGSWLCPNLQPVSVTAVPGIAGRAVLGVAGSDLSGLLSAAVGLCAGVGAGWAVWGYLRIVSCSVSGGHSIQSEAEGFSAAIRSPFVAGLVLTGGVLGWQAALGTLFVLAGLAAIVSWWTDRGMRVECQRCSLLLVAVMLQLLSWRWQWSVLGASS